MRRKEREIKDYSTMLAILEGCDCIRLGFVNENRAYIVPVNFGIKEKNEKITLYFHGAKEGRKIDMITKNPYVCFEADRKHEVVIGENACDYSFLYQSIIGYGEVSFIENTDEKSRALNCIMKHYSKRDNWTFDKRVLEKTGVMKVSVIEWSCKEH
ncbi:MAG: pyridoxamine 5'-phosphate oxidase family protein [Firmicutes bacterium]|nr:pyridoxamine 5'-phosphate oxidase family protein [Bacillota bacterium]